MEPTSSPDNARQSRGLARFWPVHGIPAPAQRHSDEDPDGPDAEQDQQVSGPPAVSHSASAQAAAAAQLATTTPGEDALTSDTQMVALGSRRGFDQSNGARAWTGNQGGFPLVEPQRDARNGDQAPRHGGGPIPNGPSAGRAPFAVPAAAPTPPSPAEQQAPRPPFSPPVASGSPTSGAPSPAQPASPFPPLAPAARPAEMNVRGIPLGAAAGPDGDGPQPPPGESSRGAASVPVSGRRRTARDGVADDEQDESADDEQLAPEPPSGPNRPATGWASVPTSGIPTISGSAAVAGMTKPGADLTTEDQRDGSRPVPGGPAGTSAEANGRAVASAGDPADGHGRPSLGAQLESRSAPATDSAAPDDGPGPGRGPGEQLDGQQPPGGSRRLASLADAEAVLPRAARRAADPAPAERAPAPASAPTGDTPLRPGDVNLSQITFWDEEAITHFRSEWHEVKANFVDDPVSALTRAHDLLTDAVNELSEAMLAERDELDPLRNTSTPDTESMRMAMRGYREFLDRILAL